MTNVRKKRIIILVIVIILLMIGVIFLINYINYTKTYQYKLSNIGYSEKEIKLLKEKLTDKQLDKILNMKYNKNIAKCVNEKYFIFSNLNKYLKYIRDNKDYKLDDTIAIINVGSNYDWYTHTKETDISKNELMLLNKYNYLTENYNPTDLETFSILYAYGEGQQLRKVAYDAYIEMFNSAKNDGFTLIVNSSYRNYQDQKQIYEDYSSWYGENEANKIAAKPGYSEHQTGLAVDIQSYCSQNKEFDQCEEFTWLKNNAYKYGFILRYPKGLEYITGYEYESWHYRYVGVKAATYIHQNNITFDEYYSYFL